MVRENESAKEYEIFSGCAAGINRITITANGDLLPCAWLPLLRMGNIKKMDVEDAMESNVIEEIRSHFFKVKYGKCKRREIYGEYRARTCLSCKDCLQEDPLCPDELYEEYKA